MEKLGEREMNRAENDATARSSAKRSFPYFKIAGMVVFAAISSYLALTIWYKLFYSNEKYYANYFYYWRINYADKNMMSETYKNIPSNSYSSRDEDMHRYVEMAQGPVVPKNIKDKEKRKEEEDKAKLTGLLNMNFVEHFPRGHLHYHTHTYIDKKSEKFNFKFNEKYLVFRKDIIKNAIKKDPYKESDTKSNAFIMGDKELENTFNPSEILKKHPEVQKFAAALSSLLKHLHAGEVYVDEDGEKKLSKKSINLAKGVVESIEDDIDPDFNLKEKHIKGFIERNGTITPTIFDTFLYSRSFYVFLLCTLNCKMNKIDIRDKDRPISVARMYARLATNMFETKLNEDEKPNIGFMERKFGKAIDTEYNDKKMKEKMAKVKEEDEDNLEILLDYFSKVVEDSEAGDK